MKKLADTIISSAPTRTVVEGAAAAFIGALCGRAATDIHDTVKKIAHREGRP